MYRTIEYTEICELLGTAVRERWSDQGLLKAFKNLVQDALGEEAVAKGQFTASVTDRVQAYTGHGPGMYAHAKPDGTMFTPEEVADIFEEQILGPDDFD
jgi:hypothetical protein